MIAFPDPSSPGTGTQWVWAPWQSCVSSANRRSLWRPLRAVLTAGPTSAMSASNCTTPGARPAPSTSMYSPPSTSDLRWAHLSMRFHLSTYVQIKPAVTLSVFSTVLGRLAWTQGNENTAYDINDPKSTADASGIIFGEKNSWWNIDSRGLAWPEYYRGSMGSPGQRKKWRTA